MTDKFVPVFDGNIPDDAEGVVHVLIPTRENIEALRDRGEYLLAFSLQRSKLAAEAMRLLHNKGVKVPTAEIVGRLRASEIDGDEADQTYLERVLELADQLVTAGKLEPTAELRQAVEVLLHFRNLSSALAQISDPALAELWAASVLSASSLGFTVSKLWGDDLAGEFRPAEDFSETMQSKGGKARAAQKAWWWPQGLERCREKRAADPTVRTSELIRALKRQFKPLLDKAREERPRDARDLPESDNGWRSAIETWEENGDLPRREA